MYTGGGEAHPPAASALPGLQLAPTVIRPENAASGPAQVISEDGSPQDCLHPLCPRLAYSDPNCLKTHENAAQLTCPECL